MKGRSYLKKLFAFIVVLTIFLAVASASTEPWKFGIISDTQWTKPDDGKNPNTCAADIIKQVDRQFIYEGVKLVIAVGDTVDVGSATSIGTRAFTPRTFTTLASDSILCAGTMKQQRVYPT